MKKVTIRSTAPKAPAKTATVSKKQYADARTYKNGKTGKNIT